MNNKIVKILHTRKIYYLLVMILLMTFCQPIETEQTITIKNKYSLTIPSFLTKVSNLNEDASLQYQHAWKEFYVIVIDEPIEDFNKALVDYNLTNTYSKDFNGYTALLLDLLDNTMEINYKSNLKDTLINNLPTKTIQISGRTEGINGYYSLAIIKGDKRYYQVMTWTLSNRKHQYDSKMSKLIYSFKEL